MYFGPPVSPLLFACVIVDSLSSATQVTCDTPAGAYDQDPVVDFMFFTVIFNGLSFTGTDTYRFPGHHHTVCSLTADFCAVAPEIDFIFGCTADTNRSIVNCPTQGGVNITVGVRPMTVCCD